MSQHQHGHHQHHHIAGTGPQDDAAASLLAEDSNVQGSQQGGPAPIRSRVAPDINPAGGGIVEGQQADTSPGSGSVVEGKVPFKDQVKGYANIIQGKTLGREEQVELGKAKLDGQI